MRKLHLGAAAPDVVAMVESLIPALDDPAALVRDLARSVLCIQTPAHREIRKNPILGIVWALTFPR
jgi:hypothetical protein